MSTYSKATSKHFTNFDIRLCQDANMMVLSKYHIKVNKNVGQNLGSGNLRSDLGSNLNFGAELGCFGALSHVLKRFFSIIWKVFHIWNSKKIRFGNGKNFPFPEETRLNTHSVRAAGKHYINCKAKEPLRKPLRHPLRNS